MAIRKENNMTARGLRRLGEDGGGSLLGEDDRVTCEQSLE